MEYYCGYVGVRFYKPWLGWRLWKRKRRKNQGDLVKGMWGPREGRVTRWRPRQQKWRSQKGRPV